jgi:hypothetical protein
VRSNPQLALKLEVGWTSTPSTALASVTWTDESDWLRLPDGISISKGRSDEYARTQPGLCQFSLENVTRRFTPGNYESPLFPYVTLRRPVRLSVKGETAPTNLMSADASSFESAGALPWIGTILGSPSVTLSRSTAQAYVGTQSMQIDWVSSGTSSANSRLAGFQVTGLTIGQQYVMSAYVYVPSGSPSVSIGGYLMGALPVSGTPIRSTLYDQWQRIACVATATATSHFVIIRHDRTASPGQGVFVDGAAWTAGTTLEALATTSDVPVFTGYIDQMDESFNGLDSVVRVYCSDAWARLQARTMRPLAVEAALDTSGLRGLWPMDGQPFTQTWEDVSGRNALALQRYRMPGFTSTFGFVRTGTYDDPSTWITAKDWNSSSFDTSTMLGNDKVIATQLRRYANGSPQRWARGSYLSTYNVAGGSPVSFGTSTDYTSGLTLEAYIFVPPTLATPGEEVYSDGVAFGLNSSDTDCFFIRVVDRSDATNGGKIQLRRRTARNTGATTLGTSSSSIATDGLWHHVAIVINSSGEVRYALDGTLSSSLATVTGRFPREIFVAGDRLAFNNDTTTATAAALDGDFTFTGWISNLAIYNRALTASELSDRAKIPNGINPETSANDARFGSFYGDTTVARFNRIGDLLNMTYSSTGSAARNMTGQVFAAVSAADLLTQVAETEQGRVWINQSGTLRLLTAGATRSTATVASSVLSDQTAVQLSDQWVINSVTATRPNGTVVTRRNQASIDENGLQEMSVTLFTDTDTALTTVCDAVLSDRANALLSVGQLQVDFVTANDQLNQAADTLLADPVGVDVIVTGLPRGAASTATVTIEGYSDQITDSTWTRSFNVGPVRSTQSSVTPGTPTAVTVTRTSTSAASVSWTAPASTGGSAITGYVVQWATSTSPVTTTWTTGATVGAVTTAAISGTPDGTVVWVRVAAINARGTGSFSTPVASRTWYAEDVLRDAPFFIDARDSANPTT